MGDVTPMILEDIPNCAERAAAQDKTLVNEFTEKANSWVKSFLERKGYTNYSIKQIPLYKAFMEWAWKHRHAFLLEDLLVRKENQEKGFLTTFLCKIYEFCNEYYISIHYADIMANRFYHFLRQEGVPEEVFALVHEERNKYVPGNARVCFVCSEKGFHNSTIVQQSERFEMFRDLDEPYIVFHCSSKEEVTRNTMVVREGNVEEMYRLFGYPYEDRHREDYENLTYH